MIMDARNIKLLFLTGSPVINDVFELSVCYNMLSGYLDKDGNTLFSTDYLDFNKYFIANKDAINPDASTKLIPTVKNADKFANRIAGLTSYYTTANSSIQHLFPTLLDLKIIKIPMSNRQYAVYSLARDKELEESKRNVFKSSPKPLQKQSGVRCV